MKRLILTAACAAFCLTTLAQKASEIVTVGSITNVTRLTQIVPTYSDDSNVTLLSITEHFKVVTYLPNGHVGTVSTMTRQWDADKIAALPDVWTNNNSVVQNNNPLKQNLQNLWNRFDNQPERAVLSFQQPNILGQANNPTPE